LALYGAELFVVQSSTPPLDTLPENRPYGFVEAMHLLVREGIGRPFLVETSQEQCLIGIDVAQASQEPLVQEEYLELSGPSLESLGQHQCRGRLGEGFRTQPPVQLL